MKLLFINMTPVFNNSSAVIRMCGFISGANKLGHICDLLTLEAELGDYSYDKSNSTVIKSYINNYYTFKSVTIYNYIRQAKIGTFKSFLKRLIKKIYRNINIYDGQVVNCQNVREVQLQLDQYDRVISVSDPKSSHKLVEELFNGNNRELTEKWIQCWGDPWFKDCGNKYALVRKKVFREEKHYLDQAKRVVYTSPFTVNEQMKLFPNNESKMVWVNQPVKPIMYIDHGMEELSADKFCLGYFGAYVSRSRNIIPLYDTCNKNGYNIKIVGDSDIKLKSTDCVEVINRSSLSDVANLENNVSAFVCLSNKSGTQIPGKIYYSAGYQKPIIIILDGERKEEMRVFFESFHRYIICENNKKSIEDAICKAREEYLQQTVYKLDERYSDIYVAKIMLGDE